MGRKAFGTYTTIQTPLGKRMPPELFWARLTFAAGVATLAECSHPASQVAVTNPATGIYALTLTGIPLSIFVPLGAPAMGDTNNTPATSETLLAELGNSATSYNPINLKFYKIDATPALAAPSNTTTVWIAGLIYPG